MSHKMKFHLIAIVLIVLIVSAISEFTKPEPLAPRIVTVVQYTPTILEATWGRNCNTNIDRALMNQPQRYAARPAVPDPSAPQEHVLARVQSNNVLAKIQGLCADQEICTLKADNTTFGEILPGCASKLELQYYCRETERVRRLTYNNNQVVKLDCSRKGR